VARRRLARKGGFDRGGARADHDAHHAVEIALREGTLVRPDRCEKCRKKPSNLRNGKTAIQAHHDDYNKPLVVRWLCKRCHFEWHRHHTAIPLRPGTVKTKRERREHRRGVPATDRFALVYDRLREAYAELLTGG